MMRTPGVALSIGLLATAAASSSRAQQPADAATAHVAAARTAAGSEFVDLFNRLCMPPPPPTPAAAAPARRGRRRGPSGTPTR